MDRSIIHVDMDEFFAAVEKLDNPSLRGQCLLIGGDPSGRGVVSTASYEARRFGCHSAMPMATAVRLCPQAIVLPGRHRRYRDVSEQIQEVFLRFTPLVEPISIDEAWLDVTGSRRLFGTPEQIARTVKQAIRDQIGLTASVGVAPNKFLAKLASDLEKPDGLTVIRAETISAILDPLGVRKLWGVGPSVEKKLDRLGVRTVGQLRRLDAEVLAGHFGEMGEHLLALAEGRDERPVTPDSQAKSISQEITFAEDVADRDELRRVLLGHVEQVARRLRRSGLKGRTVTLKLRYGDFTTLTRSRTLDQATSVTAELWHVAGEIFQAWQSRHFRPLRLLGMGASQLTDRAERQGELFGDDRHRKNSQLDDAVDRITERFGGSAVRRGRSREERS